MVKITVFLCAICVLPAASGEQMIQQIATNTYTRIAVVVGEVEYNWSTVKSLSERSLTEHRNEQLVIFRIGATEGELNQLPKPDHASFSFSSHWYDQLASMRWRVAEMTAIGHDAVLRYRDASGEVKRFVLSGNDPLRFTAGSCDVDILHFGFSGISETLTDCVQVYATTQCSSSVAVGEAIFRELGNRIPRGCIELYLRNDQWFIEDGLFPIYFLYGPKRKHPTREEFQSTATLWCRQLNGPVRCTLMRAARR